MIVLRGSIALRAWIVLPATAIQHWIGLPTRAVRIGGEAKVLTEVVAHWIVHQSRIHDRVSPARRRDSTARPASLNRQAQVEARTALRIAVRSSTAIPASIGRPELTGAQAWIGRAAIQDNRLDATPSGPTPALPDVSRALICGAAQIRDHQSTHDPRRLESTRDVAPIQDRPQLPGSTVAA